MSPSVKKKPIEQKQSSKAKRKNFLKRLSLPKHWWIFGSGCVVMLIFLVSVFRIYLSYRDSVYQLNRLGYELVDLRSAMNIDSVRQYKLQKIMKIITYHNPDLSSSEMYDIANAVYEMSVKYTNLNVDLLCAMITHESAGTWNPKIVSKAGAMGLMQIMPVTGYFLAESEGIPWTTPEEVLFNPVYNIRAGSRFLSMLLLRYGLDGALAAYNAGEKHASIWIANGKDDQFLWSETREYIPAVCKLFDQYQGNNL
jgi:soluble lytic murein transglycosylase-like protein